MKRFFLYALAFMVSLSGLSVLNGTNARAASIYDEDLQLTETIQLRSKSGQDAPLDITYDYEDVVNDVCEPHVKSAWDFAKLNGSVGVTQETKTDNVSYYANGALDMVYLWFSLNDVKSFEWNFGTIAVSNVGQIQLQLANNGNIICNYIAPEGATALLSSNPNMGWSNPYTLFYTTFAPNYPEGYDGEPVPNQPPESIASNIPQIGYSVDTDKKLYGLSIEQDVTFPTRIGGQAPPYIQWTVYDETKETVIDTKSLNLSTPYQHQFLAIGTYYLKAQYIQPPPPYALLAEDVVLGSVTFQLEVNGTLIRGGNVDPDTNECTTTSGNQECGPADPLEDCSVYGLDLGGYFQCIITNFGIWLKIQLTALFVPSTPKVASILSEFLVSLEGQLGFVYAGFNMLLEWINTLLDITPDCTIDFPGVSFFGAPVGYNFCSFEQAAPTIYNPLMLGIRLLIAAFFVFISYRRLMDILRGLGK